MLWSLSTASVLKTGNTFCHALHLVSVLAAAYTHVNQRNISCLVWLFTALSVIKYLCHILLHYNCYILCHSHTGDLCLLKNLMHMLQVY